MKKEALSQFNNPDLILAGFMIFFIGFLFIVFNTFRKANKKKYEEISRMPLENKSNGEVK